LRRIFWNLTPAHKPSLELLSGRVCWWSDGVGIK
jgi:hypothetical protein